MAHRGRLEGKVALVTGASRGIGKEIARRFYEEGASVIVCSRHGLELSNFDQEIRDLSAPNQFTTFVCDATKLGPTQKMFADIRKQYDYFDILVNNIGGVKQFGLFHELSDTDWRDVFETNIMTAVRITREALPMLRLSKSASIVNIASVAGVQAGFYNAHYGSMKAAMVHLTKYLANDYGREGIRANAIAMSTIKGGVWERDVKNKADMDGTSYEEAEARLEQDVKAKSVTGTIGTPRDVADAAIFLASDDSRFITGSCLNVDGGTVKAI